MSKAVLLHPATDVENLLTIDELAELLRVPKSWIYGQSRLKIDDPIPFLRVGKYLRFRAGDVLAWLKAREDRRRGR